MKSLIINQIYYSIRKKYMYLLMIPILIIIAQSYELYNINNIEGINVIYADGILNICGGVYKNFLLIKLITWLILTITLLMITQSTTCIMSGFDILLLTKAESKLKWWASKVISLIIITLLYSFFILILSKVIFSIFFTNAQVWSNYSKVYYPNIYNSTMKPREIEFMLTSVFVTGFIALTTLFQTLNSLLNNTVKAYISIFIVFIILSILYSNNLLIRALSPFNYPSILDMDCNVVTYARNIIFNILVSIINIIVSFGSIIKKDYVSNIL